MKRLFVLLLLLATLVGCSSLPNQQESSEEEVRTALEEVVQTASERIEANLHSQMPLTVLTPPSSSPVLEQEQIPRLQEYLDLWAAQVVGAFREATIAMPSLLGRYIEELVIEDPFAIRGQGDSSASKLLFLQYGNKIEGEVQLMLEGYLQASLQTWQKLTDRYAIWSGAKALLGDESLPPLDSSPLDHLYTVFLSTYIAQLSREELYLRTTPVYQGTGSFYEILNTRMQE